MKRIILIFPWILVLVFGGALVLQNKEVSLPIDFSAPLASPPSLSNTSDTFGTFGTSDTFVEVSRIVDGDTIDLSTGQRLRYIGIDTPESGNCFGGESTKKNMELVLGREVRLEKDVSEKDKYGRLLRYVWNRDTMVNEELVRTGYAKVSTYPPDVKYADRFVSAEREARENKRGLWADDACSAQGVSTQEPSNPVSQQPNNSSCLIKGNISTKGEKIYHLPGCGSYGKTSINEAAGEHWFCSEDEATNAGWRKAKNC